MEKNRRAIKCVIVGDACAGKTSLILRYIANEEPRTYPSTIFDNYLAQVQLDGEEIDLGLFDTGGLEDYDRLRPVSYPQTDVIIIVFSIGEPDSLEDVKEKWFPEVRHFCPNVPIILLGNQLDLRQDISTINELKKRKQAPTTFPMGLETAKDIDAAKYIECSVLTKKNVKYAIDESMRAAIDFL